MRQHLKLSSSSEDAEWLRFLPGTGDRVSVHYGSVHAAATPMPGGDVGRASSHAFMLL